MRGTGGEDAGVVDEDVHLRCARGQCANVVGRSKIGADELCLAACRLDRRDHFGTALFAPTADQHVRALTGKQLCGGAPDPGRSPRNECSLSHQLVHATPPVWTRQSKQNNWTVKSNRATISPWQRDRKS